MLDKWLKLREYIPADDTQKTLKAMNRQYNIHTPRIKAGERTIPILGKVKEAFEQERQFQLDAGIKCAVQIDGFTDFVFVNRFDNVHNQGTLNKALRRIISETKSSGNKDVALLPRFSCHSLRHTFATRLLGAGVNMKVIQEVLGHADFGTTHSRVDKQQNLLQKAVNRRH